MMPYFNDVRLSVDGSTAHNIEIENIYISYHATSHLFALCRCITSSLISGCHNYNIIYMCM
jgi:hypothetical protein